MDRGLSTSHEPHDESTLKSRDRAVDPIRETQAEIGAERPFERRLQKEAALDIEVPDAAVEAISPDKSGLHPFSPRQQPHGEQNLTAPPNKVERRT